MPPTIRRIGFFTLALAGGLVVLAGVGWAIAHEANRGIRSAILHARLGAAVEKALLESGIYIKEGDFARLPDITLEFDEDYTSGTLTIQNHPHLDKALNKLCISSCLEHYVAYQHYLSDDENHYIFELSDSRQQRQLVFNSADVFLTHSREMCGDYELSIDGKNKIPLHNYLIVGQIGSGKTYALYSLILQMLDKSVPYELYFADPKASSLAVLGDAISPVNTAESIEEIVDLLHVFHKKMIQRKAEIKERLSEKLDGTYADFGLTPHVMILDEYASFIAQINAMERKERDAILAPLKTIILEGRQLGFILWIVMQKSDANTISTDIRDNMPGKFVLGQSEKTTYETCFGASAHIPKRRYQPGQGVFAYPGITQADLPRLCHFPTLHFNVLGAVKAAFRGDEPGESQAQPPS